MSKKGQALVIVIALIIIIAIIAGIAYFCFSGHKTASGKCGDGICDAKEKTGIKFCPQDCGILANRTERCHSGFVFNTTTKTCQARLQVYACSQGIYNNQTGLCELQPPVSDICSQGTYNNQTGLCELQPPVSDICPYGAYNSETNLCEVQPEYTYECSEGELQTIDGEQRCIVKVAGTQTVIKTCSEQNGNICSSSQTCSGTLVTASDSTDCCIGICSTQNTPLATTEFLSGFKLENTNDIRALSDITFKLAQELNLDYVLVSVQYPGDDLDWSKNLDYNYISQLSGQYNVAVLPAFYKLGGRDDKDSQKYARFVTSFLKQFKDSMKIKYIEFQNEPVKDYDGTMSPRFAGTPTDLKNSDNAAYEAIKADPSLSDIQIGTAGFIMAAINEDENTIMNDYYASYFNGLKFDVLTIHNYPRTSSYLQRNTSTTQSKYNFLSEYNILKSYRSLLNDYGYSGKPILVTEGLISIPSTNGANWLDDSEVDVLLAERYVLSMSNSQSDNIIGSFISGIESSSNTALFSYSSGQSYTTTSQFNFYNKLLQFNKNYPLYSQHIAGSVNSDGYWIDEFKNSAGKKAWLAFCPVTFSTVEIMNDKGLSAAATNKQITCPQTASINGEERTIGNEPLFIEEA